MNKKFMIVASAAMLLGSFADAAIVDIIGMKFDNDSVGDDSNVPGITIQNVKVKDGKDIKNYKGIAKVFFQDGVDPTVEADPLSLGMYLDLDGDKSTDDDQLKFNFAVKAYFAKNDKPVAKAVKLETNRWEFNKSPGIANSINSSGDALERALGFTVGSVVDAEGVAGKAGIVKTTLSPISSSGGTAGNLIINDKETTNPLGALYDYESGIGELSDSHTLKFGNTGSIGFNPSAYDLRFDVATVPEPATFGLLGLAGAGLMAYRRRSKR